jgi:hypothetical protein
MAFVSFCTLVAAVQHALLPLTSTSPLRFSARGSALVGEGGGAVLVKSPTEHGGCPETTGVAVSKGTSEGAGWAVGALVRAAERYNKFTAVCANCA